MWVGVPCKLFNEPLKDPVKFPLNDPVNEPVLYDPLNEVKLADKDDMLALLFVIRVSKEAEVAL